MISDCDEVNQAIDDHAVEIRDIAMLLIELDQVELAGRLVQTFIIAQRQIFSAGLEKGFQVGRSSNVNE